MARPRTPTEKLKLRGAFKKHPERAAQRENEPKARGPLGMPPDHLTPEQQKTWLELAAMAPARVLTLSDRWVVELACRLMAKLRIEGLVIGEQAQLIQCLGRMGLTPADRSKVAADKAADKDNAFAEIAEELGGTVQ